jgi:anti-sigma B factor antagonist
VVHDESTELNLYVSIEWPAPGVVVVGARGEADVYSAGLLRRELLQVIASGAELVVVDLDETTFMDSGTLGILLGAMRRLHGKIRIVCSDPTIRRTFEVAQLDRVFDLHRNRREALARAPVGL